MQGCKTKRYGGRPCPGEPRRRTPTPPPAPSRLLRRPKDVCDVSLLHTHNYTYIHIYVFSPILHPLGPSPLGSSLLPVT
ncbi:hypothetical protein HanRHA438_Chr01g0032681 [Helianthus annuus]|nr:hypothetical protein HanRHA438_Chr01g0032681 [Helianthus annuus]